MNRKLLYQHCKTTQVCDKKDDYTEDLFVFVVQYESAIAFLVQKREGRVKVGIYEIINPRKDLKKL